MRRAGTLAALGAAGAATVGWSVVVEPRWFALRHVTVPALRPSASQPLRVLHLSDPHLSVGQEHRHRFIARCLASEPDVVVCTGDLLGHPDAVGAAVTAMAHPGVPAVCVLGSNDRYGPVRKNPLRYLVDPAHRVFGERLDTARLVAGLRAGGWQVLHNTTTVVATPAGPVAVGGLGDPHIRLDDPGAMAWDRDAGEPSAVRLGLVHAPYRRALAALADADADLVLAGHTHGGQVRLPGVGALTTNSDLPASRAQGLSRPAGEDGPWLHVSAGIGAARTSPFRLACRPEATLIDVVPPPRPEVEPRSD